MIAEQESSNARNNVDNSEMTVSELFEAWIESKSIKPKTVISYRTKYRLYLEKPFGSIKVNDITTEQWHEFENSLSQTTDSRGRLLSLDAIRMLIHQVHSIFDYGKKNFGLNDPTGDNVLPEQNITSKGVFDPSEVEKLRAAVKPYNVHHLGVMLCIETGILLSELCGTKWGDYEPDKGILKISRSPVRNNSKNSRSKPKLTESVNAREVSIPDWINDQLRLAKRVHTDAEPMIVGKQGGVSPNTFVLHYYTRFLDKAGVKFRPFPATRNTYAKNCVESGMNAEELSRLLGDPSVEYTIGKYFNSEVE